MSSHHVYLAIVSSRKRADEEILAAFDTRESALGELDDEVPDAVLARLEGDQDLAFWGPNGHDHYAEVRKVEHKQEVAV